MSQPSPCKSLPLVALLVGATSCRSAEEELPLTPIVVRGMELVAEVAATPEAQERGLMYRRSLADNAAMLFAFPDSAPRGFWMKNTFIPLSIAYLDDAGRVESPLAMAPLDDTIRYSSPGPARFALEVNFGWYDVHGVGPGDVCA